MANYYCRADGTAANKAAATGPTTDASKCMTLTVVNGETFSPGDYIYLSDKGGSFLEILIPPSSGDSSSQITFKNATGESPVISGSDTEATPSYERAYCIQIASKNYITIDGIEYRYSGGAGAADGEGYKVSGTSTGIIVQNCNGHHHKNEALKIVDTASVTSSDNEFHDNIDSDISQHDSTVLTSTDDELYNSPYGVENIGSSICTLNDVNCHDFTTAGIIGYQDDPSIEINGGTIDGKNGASVYGVTVDDDAVCTINSATIKGCKTNVRLLGSGTNTVSECDIEDSASYGIDAAAGISNIHDNTFKKCSSYSIINRAASKLYAFRNRFTDLSGSYASGFYLSGEFYCAGNVIDGDTSYGYYVTGTVNANSTIANNYINSSALRAIDASNLILNIYNNAVRNCVQKNYYRIGNCVVKNNIGDRADLPSGNGNVNSADFSAIYESTDDSDADYAKPVVGGSADGTGTDPGISSFDSYYNDVAFLTELIDIGALGLLRFGTRPRRHMYLGMGI